MGHNTDYTGTLQIAGPNPFEMAHLLKLSGLLELEPHRVQNSPPNYIALRLTPDFTGLVWDGSEKTYDMDKVLNWLTAEMRKDFPDFRLAGGFSWQSDYGEAGVLTIDDAGFAKEIVVDPLDAVKAAEGLQKYQEAWKLIVEAHAESEDKLHRVVGKLRKTLVSDCST